MDISVIFVDVAELSTNISIEQIIKLLPLSEVSSIRAIKSPHNAYVKAASSLLKYTMLSKMLLVPFSDIELEHSSKGKPFVKNHEGVYFNISHTKNACAGVFAPFEVGIDIEHVRPTDLTIAKRFFTQNEQNYIFEDETNSISRFFDVWTKKEAYIKLTGEGFARPLSSFDVLGNNTNAQFTTFNVSSFSINACSYKENSIPHTLKTLTVEELFKLAITM